MKMECHNTVFITHTQTASKLLRPFGKSNRKSVSRKGLNLFSVPLLENRLCKFDVINIDGKVHWKLTPTLSLHFQFVFKFMTLARFC